MAKRLSRATRWENAVATALHCLEELVELQQEYQEWMDNLPEGLESSPMGEKLQAVCDLDLEGTKTSVEEADGMDLPLGFGRD